MKEMKDRYKVHVKLILKNMILEYRLLKKTLGVVDNDLNKANIEGRLINLEFWIWTIKSHFPVLTKELEKQLGENLEETN